MYMHCIVQDICTQNARLILVTLQWLKYSTVPNGVTLYTEKSQNSFLSILFHNDWLQNHCWLSFKSIAPNFVAVVNVLLPICCHIGLGMPNLRIFVEYIVALLGAMTDKWVRNLS